MSLVAGGRELHGGQRDGRQGITCEQRRRVDDALVGDDVVILTPGDESDLVATMNGLCAADA